MIMLRSLGVLTLAFAPLALAEPTGEDPMLERLRQLEAEIEALRSAIENRPRHTPEQVEQTRAQVRSAAAEMTLNAGYDPMRGAFLRSDDGNFEFRPAVFLQVRHVANYRENAKPSGEDDLQSGFELRRAQFRFNGHVINPKLTYGVTWQTNRQGGAVTLLDAWVAYRLTDELSVRVGQFRSGVFHEHNVYPANGVAVEESLASALLGGMIDDRVQGISIAWGGTRDNPLLIEWSVHDGANSINSDFRDGNSNFGSSLRADYVVFGRRADLANHNARVGQDSMLMVGGGVEYSDDRDRRLVLTTLDSQYELSSGTAFLAALHANFYDDRLTSPAGGSRTDLGGLFQVAQSLTPNWDAFFRASFCSLQADGDYSEFNIGATYFFGPDGRFQHRAKITFDLGYLPAGSPSNFTGLGILQGDDPQWMARIQLQLSL